MRSQAERADVRRDSSQRTKRRSRSPSGAVGLALAAALALSPFGGLPAAQAQEQTVTIDEITDNPTAYYGQTVTITGPVEEILGPRSFTLSDADALLSEELPVVSDGALMGNMQQQISADALHGQEVEVTGTVHQFNLAAFEDQLDYDLADGSWAEWAGQPAIIATSVTPSTPLQQQPNGNEAPGNTPGIAPPGAAIAPAPGATAWMTVDRITDNPQAYYEQQVVVVGEIGDVHGERVFMIEDDDLLFDEEMVVVSSRPLAGNTGQAMDLGDFEGRRALIRGTVHQFNAAAFEDRLGIDLMNEDLDEYAGQPALIATSIVLDPNLYGPYGGMTDPSPQAQMQSVTIDQITDNANAYVGRRVTVAGEVGEALGPRSFTVEDNDLLFEEEIAVIGARPLLDRNGQPYSDDALDDLRVMVTGTVHLFNEAEIERQMGLDLSDASLDGWEGRPVIVAESVRQLP
jgi:hypothetical protein